MISVIIIDVIDNVADRICSIEPLSYIREDEQPTPPSPCVCGI